MLSSNQLAPQRPLDDVAIPDSNVPLSHAEAEAFPDDSDMLRPGARRGFSVLTTRPAAAVPNAPVWPASRPDSQPSDSKVTRDRASPSLQYTQGPDMKHPPKAPGQHGTNKTASAPSVTGVLPAAQLPTRDHERVDRPDVQRNQPPWTPPKPDRSLVSPDSHGSSW
jgi:hypothetical protein